MSASAKILAVGPYSSEIRDLLCYPANYYDDLKIGVTVAAELFHVSTRSAVRDLMEALKMNHVCACDFSHDLIAAQNLFDVADGGATWNGDNVVLDAEIADFHRLKDAGFKFYFLYDG